MGPIVDLRTEAEFKLAVLQKFYSYLDKRMPGKWSRSRTGELLDIYKRKSLRHSWEMGLKPFLQYRYASDLMASRNASQDTLCKAVQVFKAALSHPACPEFLKPKIMFRQAESYRLGQGYNRPNLCKAAALYGKVIDSAASTGELRDQAHNILHSLLYKKTEPELARLGQEHRSEKAKLEAVISKSAADLITARQATRVFQVQSQRFQEEREKTAADLQKLQNQNNELQNENNQLRLRLQEEEAKRKEELSARVHVSVQVQEHKEHHYQFASGDANLTAVVESLLGLGNIAKK